MRALVFGNLYFGDSAETAKETLYVDDGVRELHVEKGDTLWLGFDSTKELKKLQFDRYEGSQRFGNGTIVSNDEQKFQVKDICLIVKE